MLLAVDTSTAVIGLALYDGSQVIGEMLWRSRSHHTVELAPAVQDLLRRASLPPAKLTALAIATGPGSFTSLRIGMALVKGLAFALHIPIIGIPSLDILAAAQPVQELPLAAVLQAGRRRLAVAWYNVVMGKWQCQEPAEICTAEELTAKIRKPTIICGELTEEERRLLARKRRNVLLASPAASVRRPAILAELAWERFLQNDVDDPVTLSPTYLHIAEGIAA